MRLNVLLALLPMVLAAPQAKRSEPAPLLTPKSDELVANKYIVKFKDETALAAVDDAITSILSTAPEAVYSSLFQGFAAELDEETLKALRDHPDVGAPLSSYVHSRIPNTDQISSRLTTSSRMLS